MAKALVDLDTLDLTRDVIDEQSIRGCIPQAFEFRLIDGICHLDLERGIAVGYKDWDANPWWARGHIPGRPLMPGVLMCEGAAQVCTILMKKKEGWGLDKFIGLGGLDNVRFRGQVVPPCRVHFIGMIGQRSSRMARYPAQAWVAGKLAMDMELLGVLL